MERETMFTVLMFSKYCVNYGSTITKSNEERVLDLINVMPNSAEKEWLIFMCWKLKNAA
jgi:hypothetical protein